MVSHEQSIEDLQRRLGVRLDQLLQQEPALSDTLGRMNELHRSEAIHRQLFARNPRPLILYDAESLAIVDANDSAVTTYGYGREELLARTMTELVTLEDLSAFQNWLRQDPAQAARPVQIRHRCKDGSVLDAELSGFVVEESPRPIRAMHVVDVTDRRRMERRLHESERFNRAVIDSLDAHVAVLNHEGTIVAVNAQWERYAAANKCLPGRCGVGTNYLDVCRKATEPYLENAREALRGIEAVLGGVHRHFQVEYPCPTPTREQWYLMSVTRLPGDRDGAAVCHTDITQIKLIQRELERSNETLDEAARKKDEFLAILSHELRTPLAPVMMAVSSLLSEPNIPADQQSMLNMIQRNIETQVRLIDDLLDVTRITRGKLQLFPKLIDAHETLRQAVEVCRPGMQAAGLQVEVDLTAGEFCVEADPARLQQAFWNLIKNAVKFTPRGGRITIRTRNKGQGASPAAGIAPHPLLVVEVQDTGIGIAPEALTRIFDPFEQADLTVTRRFGGMGLGLAISRYVVESHRGRLQALSAGRGQGSTFTIELPTIPAPLPRAENSPSVCERHSAASIRILLVDDHLDTLSVLARLLQGLGYTVRTAEDVVSALLMAESYEPMILISDIGLPDGSGLDLMRRLSHRGPIKGIALSGYGAESDIQKSMDAGFSAHLTKPVNFQQMEELIFRLVGDQVSGA